VEDYDRLTATCFVPNSNSSKAGITSDYRIPEYMREEPLPPHNAVFDVPDSDLDTVFDTL
jgi:aldehyde:ferredoxin oxidoreductase